MRLLFLVVLILAGCASQPKPDPQVLIYWGPDSLEYWEECDRLRVCNQDPEACAVASLESTE